jgi:hypothetical protein
MKISIPFPGHHYSYYFCHEWRGREGGREGGRENEKKKEGLLT